jgi:hypothetical protein
MSLHSFIVILLFTALIGGLLLMSAWVAHSLMMTVAVGAVAVGLAATRPDDPYG